MIIFPFISFVMEKCSGYVKEKSNTGVALISGIMAVSAGAAVYFAILWLSGLRLGALHKPRV